MLEQTCSIGGCSGEPTTHGLCHKHYMRLYRHGTVEDTRPFGYGSKSNHPLYRTWYSSRKKMCEEWKDFWKFIADIGERPSDKHYVSRRDKNKQYSKENVVWRSKLTEQKEGETEAQYMARYQRIRRAVLPEESRKKGLKRCFGLTLEQYEQMHKEQGGVCAICKKEETATKNRSAEKKNLSVDHCHGKGHIRGLLCARCNTALGLMFDSEEIMSEALNYIRKHKRD